VAAGAALRAPAPPGRTADAESTAKELTTEPPPLERCFPEDDVAPAVQSGAEAAEAASSPAPRTIGDLLDRAAERFDARDYARALACADEAIRDAPRSVEAHHDRAAALAGLGRLEEARVSFELALAMDPNDPETLAAAADLFVNRLGPGHELTLVGLEYARRGARRVRRPRERALAGRLALVEAQALNDLGRTDEAFARAEVALNALSSSREPAAQAAAVDARYERAVALFELSRFRQARHELEKVVALQPEDAYTHYQLGLVLDRFGLQPEAHFHFERATTLAPKEFPPHLDVSKTEFASLVTELMAALPVPAKQDLAKAHVVVEEAPSDEDLLAPTPPLSPTILGLFRGAPLCANDGATPERTIVLYRKNLIRAARSRDELRQQVRTTLLHELGHLRGEDDDELRTRGLE
jgi:tetratricopeptide (TPR) repeat protein